MSKIRYTLKKEFLLIIRDVHAVAVLFVMPAVFIMIMSLAMRDLFELHNTVNIDVLTVNHDEGKESGAFLKAIEELRTFKFHLLDKDIATEKVKEQMHSRDFKFALMIGKNFSAVVGKEGKGKDEKPLELLVDPSVNVQTQLVLRSALEGKLAKLKADRFIDSIGEFLDSAGIDRKKLQEAEESQIEVSYVHKGGRTSRCRPQSSRASPPGWYSPCFLLSYPFRTRLSPKGGRAPSCASKA